MEVQLFARGSVERLNGTIFLVILYEQISTAFDRVRIELLEIPLVTHLVNLYSLQNYMFYRSTVSILDFATLLMFN